MTYLAFPAALVLANSASCLAISPFKSRKELTLMPLLLESLDGGICLEQLPDHHRVTEAMVARKASSRTRDSKIVMFELDDPRFLYVRLLH